MRRKLFLGGIVGVAIALLTACGGSPPAETVVEEEVAATGGEETGAELTALKQAALETYADIVFAGYEDAYNLATELQTKIEAFVADPSQETQQAAKEAWLAAREPYGPKLTSASTAGPVACCSTPQWI